VIVESVEDLVGISAEDARQIDALIAEEEVKNAGDPPNILKFTEIFHQFPVGFVVYADFEAFITPNGDRDDHIPSRLCCLTVSIFPEYNTCAPVVYSGPNVMREFFAHLYREEARIDTILKQNVPMKPLTKEQCIRRAITSQCKCCGTKFCSKHVLSHHHQHVTGELLAFICGTCNLKLKPRKGASTSTFFFPEGKEKRR